MADGEKRRLANVRRTGENDLPREEHGRVGPKGIAIEGPVAVRLVDHAKARRGNGQRPIHTKMTVHATIVPEHQRAGRNGGHA